MTSAPRTVILALSLAAAAVAAADQLQLLENAYILHSKLFDQESALYTAALERSSEAMGELARATAALDRDLADQSIPVATLRSREAELGELRAVAFARAEETAAARQRLYTRLDGLLELGLEIERTRNRSLVFTDRVDGMWRIEVLPTETFGVIRMRSEGTLIHGLYQMSTGSRGSLQGTRTKNKVKLERIDALRGNDVTLEGYLDSETGEIHGTWRSLILGRGGPEAGTWTARKLSDQEAAEQALAAP